MQGAGGPGRMPRVLWVSLAQEWSGAEESLLEILRCAQGTVGVAAPPGPFAARLRDTGWDPLPLPAWTPALAGGPGRWLAAGGGAYRLAQAVAAHARARAADLLAANGLRAGMAVSLANGWPDVWAVRDNLLPGAAASLARLLARRRRVTVVANSRFIQAQCRGAFGPSVPVHAVHPGVRWPTGRACLRGQIGAGAHAPVVGVVGQIAPWKRQLDAVRAARIVRGVYPDLRLVVVGSPKFRPENRAYLARLVEEAQPDGVRTVFLGERSDLSVLYPDMDALLVPSSAEPFGRVAAEALGYGVPVVGCAPGGLGEIVSSPERGRLVPTGDVFRLAGALLEVLAQGRLPLVAAAAARAEFGAEAAGQRWDAVLRAAVWGGHLGCAA